MEKIRPQQGFQTDFVTCRADILIAGSAAGVGKTFSLLLDPVRHINKDGWGAVIFRRTGPQIRSEGGLWDSSKMIYYSVNGTPRESFHEWSFPSGAKFKFSHLEHEKNIYDWQGAEIPYIGFDELTHFTEKMFFYLLTRNRSTCGVKPRVRATCNPDPDSWVAKFVSWWIGDDGFPIPERCGKLRYFIKNGDQYIWGNSEQEVIDQARFLIDPIVAASKGQIQATNLIKSLTFIPGSIYDNKELLIKNPDYIGNLLSQDDNTKKSLLDGNWSIRISEDDLIDYDSFYNSFRDYDSNGSEDFQQKTISADIALEGSDKLVIGYFEGYCLKDIKIIDKSNGKDIVGHIEQFQHQYDVRDHRVVYDGDGVGGFIDGYISGKSFKNGSKALKDENYQNLKTQCFYYLAKMINSDKFSVSEKVRNTAYSGDQNVMDRMIYERRAIKKYKADHDGKLRILPKNEMKVILNGTSPDIFDMCMMRMYFDLKKTNDWGDWTFKSML